MAHSTSFDSALFCPFALQAPTLHASYLAISVDRTNELPWPASPFFQCRLGSHHEGTAHCFAAMAFADVQLLWEWGICELETIREELHLWYFSGMHRRQRRMWRM